MGFWDVRLADLEAQGETFSQDEVRVLEEGGWLLHAHPLEHADMEVSDYEVDRDGEVVLIPEPLRAFGPRDAYQVPSYLLPPGGNSLPTVTYAAHIAAHADWYRRDWREFPCYIGLATSESDVEIFGRCDRTEEPMPYAYWNCVPVSQTDADTSVMLQLRAMAGLMVEEALYYELRNICDLGYNYYDPHDAWLYRYHPMYLGPSDVESLRAQVADFTGWDKAEEVEWHLQIVGGEFEALFQAHVLDTHIEALAHNANLGMLPWKPLTHYLEQRGYYEAADLWSSLIARRRQAIERLPPVVNHWGINENEVTD